jgi:hypothetical protein
MSVAVPVLHLYTFMVRTEETLPLYILYIKFPLSHSAKSRVHLKSRALVSCHRISRNLQFGL